MTSTEKSLQIKKHLNLLVQYIYLTLMVLYIETLTAKHTFTVVFSVVLPDTVDM